MQHPVKVRKINGQPHCTSMDLARTFGRKHKEVMDSIANATRWLSAPFIRRNFSPYSEVNSQGKTVKGHLMTFAGFSMIALGFAGERAAKFREGYVTKFEEMRTQIENSHRLEMAHQLLLNDGQAEFVRRTLPFRLCILSFRAMGLLPEMSNERLKKLVQEKVIDGRIVPRESFVYKDSMNEYLQSLGIVPTGIFAGDGGANV